MTAQPFQAARPATSREALQNPKIASNLEAAGNVMIEEEKRRDFYEAFQRMVRGIRA